MKKGYKKPQIFIEQFELIEQISTACESEYQTHGHYYNSCSYDDPDMGNVFVTEGVCGFVFKKDENGKFEYDCLNGFGNAFSS